METYQELRNKIQNGDIVFFQGNNFYAKVIKLFTGSAISHCGIAFWAMLGDQERLLFVDIHGGFRNRIVTFSLFAEDRLMEAIVAPKDWDQVKDEALKRVGIEKYGWLDAIYVGIREWLSSHLNITLPSGDFPGEICTEFVTRVYGMNIKNVSPGQLYALLIKEGHTSR